MKKVVINRCYGGFGLSPLAQKRYMELKNPETKLFFYGQNVFRGGGTEWSKIKDFENCQDEYLIQVVLNKDIGDNIVDPKLTNEDYVPIEPERNDPLLIQVVEELGEKANTKFSKLEIIPIDGKYRICEYDGMEYIETPDDIIWEEA